MSGPYKEFADEVMANLTGQRDASHLLHVIRQGCSPADALLEAFKSVAAADNHERLRGFARGVQKALEGRA